MTGKVAQEAGEKKLSLMPYQAEDVERAVSEFRGRVLLGHDMGLGKSAIAINVAQRLRVSPVLIICPASLRLNWLDEVFLWARVPDIAERVRVVATKKDAFGGSVCITSYEQATKRISEVRVFAPKTLIVDESHLLKTTTSARAKAIIGLCRTTRHCLLLTGTPIINRPIELYAQLLALLGRKAPHYIDYGVRYCGGHKVEAGFTWCPKEKKRVPKLVWDFNGASNLGELEQVLSRVMIRRKKEEVLKDLPEKRRAKLRVECGIHEAAASLEEKCRDALNIFHGNAGAAYRYLMDGGDAEADALSAYRELGGLKLPAAIEWLKNNARAETPIVVFAHHKLVVTSLCDAVRGIGVSADMIHGSMPLEERHQVKARFQAGEIGVLLCSITAANYGLTLTAASEMLVVELPWSAAVAEQMEARIHRIGQNNATVCRYLVAARTWDEALWHMINAKSKIATRVVDGERRGFDAGEEEHEGVELYGGLVSAVLLGMVQGNDNLTQHEEQL